MPSAPKTSRRGLFSWMLFDWAAQPFHTLIITFVFAPYFAATVAPSPEEGQALWGLATGTAGLAIALLAPILGTLADATGPRKPWIAGFGLLVALGSAFLYLATPGGTAPIPLVLIAFAIGLIGVEFAAVFNNSMMPALVPRAELGKLSGSGWALGYVGGLISLVIALGLMSASPETGRTLFGLSPILGLDPQTHAGDRAAGPFTAIWFTLFIIPLLLFTPDMPRRPGRKAALGAGLEKLWQTIKSLPGRPSYAIFLVASMIYRDGLNALYAFGGIYAAGVLGLSIIQIGLFGILATITGTIGAFVGGRMDARFGPRRVVFVNCWLLVIAATIVVSTTSENFLFILPVTTPALPLIVFYVAGGLIGAAGGALQAADRTLLVDQVEPGETTEAFGLYALTGRATSFIGPFSIGLLTALSHSQRIGILPIIVLLALGALALFRVRDSYKRT